MAPTIITALSAITSQDANDSMLVDNQRVSNFVYGGFGIACTVGMFTLLVLVMCVYKAYKTTLQRIILYHIILTLFCEIAFGIQIVLNFNNQRLICKAVSYFWMYSTLAWHVYTTVETTYLFFLGCCLVRGRYDNQKCGKIAEFICTSLAVCFPLIYIFANFDHDKTFEILSCDKLASFKWYKDVIILYVTILTMCTEVFVVCITLWIMFIHLNRRLQNERLKILMKHLLKLTAINTTIMIFVALLAIYCIYRYRHSTYPSDLLLQTIYQIIASVGYPLLFALSMIIHSLVSIRHQGGCAWPSCCRRYQALPREDVMDSTENFTNPTSCPLNQPSHTCFSAPYTGAFTQVTSEENIDD